MTDLDVELRKEITQAQEARSDLLKWKLLLVASVGAAGLGLSDISEGSKALLPHLEWILGLIPFMCVYVDLLCSNLNLRIVMIGAYLRQRQHDPYEEFVSQHRTDFCLEDWALFWSTVFLAGALLIYGACVVYTPLLIGCAVAGVVLSFLTKGAYERRLKDVERPQPPAPPAP